MRCIIQNSRSPVESFVAGFNPGHQIVTVTYDRTKAKAFPTSQAAYAFLDKYADAGYGLKFDACYVITV